MQSSGARSRFPAAANDDASRSEQRPIAFHGEAALQSRRGGTRWAAAEFVHRIDVAPNARRLFPTQPPAFDDVPSASAVDTVRGR